MKNKSFWWYFRLITFSLLIFVFAFFGFVSEGTYGINKTVGWYWDLSNLAWWIGLLFPVFSAVFFIGLIAFLLKKLVEFLK